MVYPSKVSRYYLTIEREYERSRVRVDVWRDYDVQVSLAYL
ncbi:MAG: hypothetical protein QXW05_06230 [Ignisphaera sp.]